MVGSFEMTKDEGDHVIRSREVKESENGSDYNSPDDNALMRLGKKPVLKRNFGFLSILGFSCTVLITWEGSLVLFMYGFQNGGPSGVIYGFILIWIGTLSCFTTLSELTSMAPTSGGQYHWVSMLAPSAWRQFLSYTTGWLTVCGWQAFLASAAYLTGTMIQGLIILVDPNYNPQGWHGTLLLWGVTFFCVSINTVVSGLLPKFEAVILFLHILGFFAILIPLVVLGPHADPQEVFNDFYNGGLWPTQGLSFMVGLIGNIFAFFGADGAIHMSEEIFNAQVTVPRSILMSVAINGTLGFGMLLAILFCLGNLQNALDTPTGYPFIEIFQQATNSLAGSALMTSIIIALAVCSTVGIMASASRMLWAFARDKGVPGHVWVTRLSNRTMLPISAITITTIIPCALGLIVIGSATAFNAIISLSVAGLFSSYTIVSALLLWRRLNGSIAEVYSPENTEPGRIPLVWGPWRLRGIWGIANNTFTVCYLIVMFFFSFWPSTAQVNAESMNYTALIFGVTIIFSMVYYVTFARHSYRGPVFEVEL